MKIGIDFDDVLVDFVSAYIEFNNQKYGANLRYEDITTLAYNKVLGITVSEQDRRMFEFYQTEFFRNLLPFSEAREILQRISSRHLLFIVTARPYEILEETLASTHRHFTDIFSWVHFGNGHARFGNYTSKAEICKREEIELIIDDSADNCAECHNAGIRAILLDRPWNKVEVPKGVMRVYNLEEMERLVESSK